MRRQGGYLTTGIAAALFAVGLGFVLANSSLLSKETVNNFDLDRARYIEEARVLVDTWYRRNITAVDTPGFAITEDEIFRQAGVQRRLQARAAISDTIVQGQFNFRRVVVWVPPFGAADTTMFDPVTGVLTPGLDVRSAVVDGLTIQTKAFADTMKAAQRLAGLLEARFKAKLESDPNHNVIINYFRPADGSCVPQADDLPCLDVYVNANTVDLRTLLGADPAGLTDAWGGQFQISNGTDSITDLPPFTMAIRATTPWGAAVRTIAVQPIN